MLLKVPLVTVVAPWVAVIVIIVILSLLWDTLLSRKDWKRLPGTFMSLDSGLDWLCMENFPSSLLFFESKFGRKMGSCMYEKGNVFFWMLPFHHVVQPGLEMQQKGDLCAFCHLWDNLHELGYIKSPWKIKCDRPCAQQRQHRIHWGKSLRVFTLCSFFV